ncbi:MAG: DUF397 domain-containing protein [Labedaea sp.]
MTTWRKSSFSDSNTNCVEIAWHKSSLSDSNTDCVEVGWHKSSFSGENTNCVEVGRGGAQRVGVRDSKNPTVGELSIDRSGWRAFLISLG